ncbi:hypothetical protein CTI12_AA279250 [Artemisia annua]|uniref:Fungal lipase-type domain-containing protein n=1 Tax=Artemisia annua TaxID=35608 RepID=A0A2U1N4S5_ARTAN|nr:hypothetical protein CTI12_AA279250 [Artemisia annua]
MDMYCDKSFSTGKYMLLDHEKVGVVDLVQMLHSIDIKKRNFVDCPNDMIEESFKRRWLLSMSVLAQKILKSIAKPLADTGSAIEYWLNLVSCNGNLGGLIWNLIRGEMIQPDKTSATFVSFTGNLDTRVELDKTITKCGDKDRYISLLSVMAAKASYENHAYLQYTVTDIWKMELLGSYDFWNDYQQKATTQAFMLRDKIDDYDLIVVAFRGTETFDADAWSSDVDLSWYELKDMGKVHGGFMKALGLKKSQGFEKDLIMNPGEPLAYYVIRDMLKQALKENNKTKFIVTGHSLGGALAVLFTAVLMKDNEVELLGMLEGVYTYGQPRVGDETFGHFMEKNMEIHQVKYYRTVYSNDLVPRLPYDDSTMMFKHFGTCLYFDSFYNGKIVDEEPNKNYFSLLSAIPKLINAGWEIIRSFVIPYTRGADYSEGFLLKMYRLVGLMIAGVPAHGLQDYVNSVRIRSELYKDHSILSNITTTLVIEDGTFK